MTDSPAPAAPVDAGPQARALRGDNPDATGDGGQFWETDTVAESESEESDEELVALVWASPALLLDDSELLHNSSSSRTTARPEGFFGRVKALGSAARHTLRSCSTTAYRGAASLASAIGKTDVWKTGRAFITSIGDALNPMDAPHGQNFMRGSLLTSTCRLLPSPYQLPFMGLVMTSVAMGPGYNRRPSDIIAERSARRTHDPNGPLSGLWQD